MEKIEQLSRDAWIDESLRVLAEKGATAMRADPLAKRLGVSRGSFYWHFEDVAAFHRSVLERWETIAVDEPYGSAIREDARSGIVQMIRTAFGAPLDLERAVHSWSATSLLARAATERVNYRRVTLLAGLFRAAGLNETQAEKRAVVLYWTFLGRVVSPELSTNDNALPEIELLFGYDLA